MMKFLQDWSMFLFENKKLTKKEWSDELFKKYPKGEIIKGKKYYYFFKSEDEVTKVFISSSEIDEKKAKEISVSKYKK